MPLNLAGLLKAGGAGFQGYGQDKQRMAAEVVQAAQMERQRKQDAVAEQVRAKAAARPDLIASLYAKARGGDVAAQGGLLGEGAATYGDFDPAKAVSVARDPVADHAANRKFDVANPLPSTAAPQKDNLITAPNEKGELVRQVDRAGLPVPEMQSTAGSAAIRKAVAANKTQIDVIDDALKELDAYPDAVGAKRALGDVVPALGGVSDYVNQRVDPKGVMARAQIANVGSLIIHDRSGAAVTLSEFPRLAPFVPRSGDTPQVIRDKLTKLRQNLGTETSFLEKGMVSTPSGVNPGTPPGIGSREAAEAHLKAQGKTAQQILQILGPP